MIRKVYKYPTGAEIPDGAIYLSTQVETHTSFEYHQNGDGVAHQSVRNEYVWHYFLVPVPANEASS